MSCYLSCENIELKVGFHTLITNFSLILKPSQSIAITGSNGTGKTTLLRVLAGISKPHNGKVIAMEEQIYPNNETKHEHLSVFLSNIPSLLLDHCAIWNLEFFANSFGLKFSLEDYKHALKKVGLENRENQIARTLSTGQKRRLSLAGLILIKPNIILADEPTNGLDELGSNLCISIFEDLKQNNSSSIIVATHDKNIIDWCQEKISLENFIPSEKKLKSKIKVLL
ncbi:ATP-binding cassette domain-containing protein [Silvanigrella paludirubra]|uniref:ATP-binding cassette domain-containing protein n=1 Tax=Silvanigrella paludirubra TaxID=2499159 RepID=A0A6N6VUI5_9BACT|nr:ATP-binding cassette domain-containing protein [Silvanigrella paludirubra]KAB8039216.1 ATP-binding cassette domain-containing protein [Silvanigrella paludirubra]